MKEKLYKELSEDKAFKKGMGRQVKILKADRISVLTQPKVKKEIFKRLKRTLPSKEIKMQILRKLRNACQFLKWTLYTRKKL